MSGWRYNDLPILAPKVLNFSLKQAAFTSKGNRDNMELISASLRKVTLMPMTG